MSEVQKSFINQRNTVENISAGNTGLTDFYGVEMKAADIAALKAKLKEQPKDTFKIAPLPRGIEPKPETVPETPPSSETTTAENTTSEPSQEQGWRSWSIVKWFQGEPTNIAHHVWSPFSRLTKGGTSLEAVSSEQGWTNLWNNSKDFWRNGLPDIGNGIHENVLTPMGQGFTTRGNWFYDHVFDHPDFSVKQFGLKTGDFFSQHWKSIFGAPQEQPQPPAEATTSAPAVEEIGLTTDLNTSNTIPNAPINLERESIDIPLPKKPEDDILTSKALDTSAQESVEKTLKDFRPTIPGFDPK